MEPSRYQLVLLVTVDNGVLIIGYFLFRALPTPLGLTGCEVTWMNFEKWQDRLSHHSRPQLLWCVPALLPSFKWWMQNPSWSHNLWWLILMIPPAMTETSTGIVSTFSWLCIEMLNGLMPGSTHCRYKPPQPRLLLPVAPAPHCHSFTHCICNCHPCTCLRCKQAWLLLLALCWPPCLSTGVFGSGLAFCCPPNWRHT